jgi:hypothetical protein
VKEAPEDRGLALVPGQGPPERLGPRERPLDGPGAAPELPAVLRRRSLAVPPVRADQAEPERQPPRRGGGAVERLVGRQRGGGGWVGLQLPGHGGSRRRLGRAGDDHVGGDRQTPLGDDGHQPRSLAFAGLAGPVVPFFAGTKPPSIDGSAAFDRPRAASASRAVARAPPTPGGFGCGKCARNASHDRSVNIGFRTASLPQGRRHPTPQRSF